jgi:hypothetical protein
VERVEVLEGLLEEALVGHYVVEGGLDGPLRASPGERIAPAKPALEAERPAAGGDVDAGLRVPGRGRPIGPGAGGLKPSARTSVEERRP